ncbi:hypothetical protein TNCT_64201 [Trichonephila clavata]|uniref:Uncharacterized protein n=1 Tax=Trichonephila clavata TaxID=2740835 RepID=A0A8X6H0C8_TRICU|nr:hypothetical protein TNCT_64201 [Trichonephila clavata]
MQQVTHYLNWAAFRVFIDPDLVRKTEQKLAPNSKYKRYVSRASAKLAVKGQSNGEDNSQDCTLLIFTFHCDSSSRIVTITNS